MTVVLENNFDVKLPKGWIYVPLKEVVDPIKGKKPKNIVVQKSANVVPYINIRAFEKKIFDQFTDDNNCPRCIDEDILLVWDGAREGLVGTGVSGVIGSTLTKLQHVIIESKYLYYFMQTQYGKLNKHPKGIGIPHVNPDILWNLQFPLSPLNEQKKIVSKIEELFSKIDYTIDLLTKTKLKLNQYRQSLLNAAVGGTLFGNDGNYPKKPISEVIESIEQGWSPRCQNYASPKEDIWAVMKTTAIQKMKFDGEQNKELPNTLEPRIQYELKEGDLLITRAGPRSRVGIACLIRKTRKRLLLCDKAYRIQFKKDLIYPAFLEIVLNAPHMVREIDRLKTGISDSGVNITQDRFSDLLIPFPSRDEQKNIVITIENIFLQIDKQEKSIDLVLRQSLVERSSILNAAFTGRLIPQDPNDEPAEILLEKIKQEKEKLQEVQKINKSKKFQSRRAKNVN